MKRYFFDQRHGFGNILGNEGVGIATDQEAIAHMRSLLVRIIRDKVPDDEYGAIFVNVLDSDGNHVSSASISIQTERSSDERRPLTTTTQSTSEGQRSNPQRGA